jgi:hypothetical protein
MRCFSRIQETESLIQALCRAELRVPDVSSPIRTESHFRGHFRLAGDSLRILEFASQTLDSRLGDYASTIVYPVLLGSERLHWI